MDKHNIIVCSKNRSVIEPNASQITVSLNNDLICKENEYWTVNIASFNMIKSFYAVQNNLNNVMNVHMKHKVTGDYDDTPYFRGIAEGNYTVRTLVKELQEKLFGLVDISYDSRLNKFLFKRAQIVAQEGFENPDDYDFYIEPLNSGVFLGLENNQKFLVPEEGAYSTNFINIAGYTSMLIKISGGVSIDNSIMNITNEYYEPSRVLAVIDLQQVAPMDSITYSNESTNTNNLYKISNNKINNFTIEIVNEDNIVFPQMSDYILNLCFEKHKEQSEITNILKFISTRINDLIFYILYAFDKMDISKPNFS